MARKITAERQKLRQDAIRIRQIGMTSEEVHERLGVGTMHDWLNDGKTLEAAISMLTDDGGQQ